MPAITPFDESSQSPRCLDCLRQVEGLAEDSELSQLFACGEDSTCSASAFLGCPFEVSTENLGILGFVWALISPARARSNTLICSVPVAAQHERKSILWFWLWVSRCWTQTTDSLRHLAACYV